MGEKAAAKVRTYCSPGGNYTKRWVACFGSQLSGFYQEEFETFDEARWGVTDYQQSCQIVEIWDTQPLRLAFSFNQNRWPMAIDLRTES